MKNFPCMFAFAFAVALFGLPARAHISLEQGGTHKSGYGDGELKDAPCGRANGTRGTNVFNYKGGEQIQITISEYIPHPSYFRIAFDEDGDDDFVEPQSIEPIDPNRACPFNAADKCGAPDFYNSPSVLSGMDNLNPHVTAGLGEKYTWDVTLPSVNCTNCTLQIIQVMQDTIHGAYNPTQGDPNDTPYIADNYHQCIDMVLEGGAVTPPPGTQPAPSGSDDGGCALARSGAKGAASQAGLIAALLLPLWRLRRRRRSS